MGLVSPIWPGYKVLQAGEVSEGGRSGLLTGGSAIFRWLLRVQAGVAGETWTPLLCCNLLIWLRGRVVQTYFYLCHHQGVLWDFPLQGCLLGVT